MQVEQFLALTAGDPRYAERRRDVVDLLIPLVLQFRSDSVIAVRMLRSIAAIDDPELLQAIRVLHKDQETPRVCSKRLPCDHEPAAERRRLLDLEAAEVERERVLELEARTLAEPSRLAAFSGPGRRGAAILRG